MKSTLKVGDKIKDNDPRMGLRILTVSELGERIAAKDTSGRTFRISSRRIFCDGKLRRSGFHKLVMVST